MAAISPNTGRMLEPLKLRVWRMVRFGSLAILAAERYNIVMH